MLSVVFGRTTPIFLPGEVLTGDVVLSATAEYNILDLTVNFCGISEANFVSSEGKGKCCEKIEESDIHLDVLHHLVRSYRGVVIEPGVHTYPFSLKLPPHLPSYYKSPYGNISYYVHVHLQTSASSQDFRKSFFVVAPVNINVFYAFQTPQSAEVIKKYGLFSNKTIRLKASVTSTCFVPGDLITVIVEVGNDTNRHVQYLFCILKQITNVVVQLRDETVNRVTKQCLKTEVKKLSRSNRHHTWICQLPTSALLTPTIANSSLVFVTYSIQVSAKLARVPIPPEVEIPIVFGTRAPVRPQHTSIQQLPSDANITRRISYQSQSTNCSPVSSNVTGRLGRVSGQTQPSIIPRRRRYYSQPPLSSSTPPRRISHQIQNFTSNLSQRLSVNLQSLKDLEKTELCQSEA